MASSDPYQLWECTETITSSAGAGAGMKAAVSPGIDEFDLDPVLLGTAAQMDPYLDFGPGHFLQTTGAVNSLTDVRLNSAENVESETLPKLGLRLCREGFLSEGSLMSGFPAELFASSDAFDGGPAVKKKRRWSLFPLPVDFEAVLNEANHPSTFLQQVRAWSSLACLGLNCMAGEKGPFPQSRGSGQVNRVLFSIHERVERFFDGGDLSVERLETESLWQDLLSKRLGYDGEELSQPHPLSFHQILGSVPPVGHGGSVAVLPLVEGTTKWFLENPRECILEPSLQKPGANRAAVHIVPGDEEKVWGLLQERGVIDWLPLSSIYHNEKGPFLSGIFGVPKAGRFDSAGRQILRVVMNLKPVNRILRTILGDIGDLPMAPAWNQLFLAGEEELILSQSDMASAFYLFAMPPQWQFLFGFNSIHTAHTIGLKGDTPMVPVCKVLPMGWASSVGVMQMVSRRLLRESELAREVEIRRSALTPPWFVEESLRQGSERWWQVYLDNYMCAEIFPTGDRDPAAGRLLQQAVDEWDRHGVLNVPEKQVKAATEATELGVRIHGKKHLIGAGGSRLEKIVAVTLMLLRQRLPKRRLVQIVLGRWIFVLQFKRQAMAILSQSWKYLMPKEDKRRWWSTVQNELWLLVFLSPLLQMDVASSFNPLVTCSDASEVGGAVAISTGLTPSGNDIAHRLRSPDSAPQEIPVVVVSLFNGIGGSFRSYDVAGVVPIALIAVECDSGARRVTRRAWPRAVEIDDVRKVDAEMIRSWCNTYPRAVEFHVIAGFPCVHLSSARAGRLNLEGEGSNLFWELVRILETMENIMEPRIKVEYLVENVASMDVSARQEISGRLGVEPLWLCPSDLLPVSRPRLAWSSKEVRRMPGVALEPGDGFTRVKMSGEGVADAQWVEEGWRRCDPQQALPTFMKAIKRARPPDQPAGISRCDEGALQRWHSDSYKFPPYQYRRQYLLKNESNELSYSDPRERELLLGFGWKHVAYPWSASKAKDDPQGHIDKQMSLLGDSFSILSFGWLVSQMCKAWVSPLSPSQVVRRLGLSPGAGLRSSMEAPMKRSLCYGFHERAPLKDVSLVAQLSRHVNHTGSDVSLALGVPFSAKGQAHASAQADWWGWKVLFRTKWKLKSHINALEMKMILQSVQWRSRFSSSINSRWVHLADSMVSNYILSKGRTSSVLLQPIVRVHNAYLLALNAVQLHAHVESAENPTDAASREEEDPQGSY